MNKNKIGFERMKIRSKNGKIPVRKNNIKNKKDKITWQLIIPIVAGIIIFAFMIFFAVRIYTHYTDLKNHRDYFKQHNAPIQDWMTVRSIVKYYNISEDELYSELNVSPGIFANEIGIDNSTLIDKMTIQSICVTKHLDCNAVINKLNSIKRYDTIAHNNSAIRTR
jgi:hypothetical protein